MATGGLAKVGASLLAFGAGAGLTFVLVDPSDATPTPVAQAWIDRPLDGSSVEVGDVQLIAHATDPDGLAEVVLTIDGDEVHTADGGGEELVTVETTWTPPGPGAFVLMVVGTDDSGHDGEAATATFTVGEPGAATTTTTARDGTTTTDTTTGEESTTTTTDGTSTTAGPGTTTPGTTVTTRPGTTTSTTPPPCRPATPSPRTPTPGQRILLTRIPVKFSWNYAGCGPDHFTVQVSTHPGFPPPGDDYSKQVTVPGGDLDVDWEPLSCNLTYYWRMRAVDAGGSSAWTSVRSFDTVC